MLQDIADILTVAMRENTNGWVVNRLMLMPELKLEGSDVLPDIIHQDGHQQMFFDVLHGMDKGVLARAPTSEWVPFSGLQAILRRS